MYTLRQHFAFPVETKTLRDRTAFINQAMLELSKKTNIPEGDFRIAPKIVHESAREVVVEFQLPAVQQQGKFYNEVYAQVNAAIARAAEELPPRKSK